VERLASILTVDNAYIAEVEYDGGETLELACDADTDLLLRVVTTALGVYRIRASHPYGSDYDVDPSSNFAVPVTPVVQQQFRQSSMTDGPLTPTHRRMKVPAIRMSV